MAQGGNFDSGQLEEQGPGKFQGLRGLRGGERHLGFTGRVAREAEGLGYGLTQRTRERRKRNRRPPGKK